MAIRLNIGGGQSDLPGFINIDRRHGREAYPLDYADDSVDEIYCSHLIEHFGLVEAQFALHDWVRALKPGSVIRLATVDLMKLATAMVAGNPERLPILSYLYGGQYDENDFHKSGYNDWWLEKMMADAGLENIQPWESEYEDCAAYPISLNRMGTKRI
jgi:ubiquinone/menaquinone biosynthesis C-methylase UbiE